MTSKPWQTSLRSLLNYSGKMQKKQGKLILQIIIRLATVAEFAGNERDFKFGPSIYLNAAHYTCEKQNCYLVANVD